MHSIKIDINPQGDVTIKDVVGGGSNCTEITKKLEKLLGSTNENTRSYTDEYTGEITEEQQLDL